MNEKRFEDEVITVANDLHPADFGGPLVAIEIYASMRESGSLTGRERTLYDRVRS